MEHNRLWFWLSQSYFPNLSFSYKRQIKNQSALKSFLSELQCVHLKAWEDWSGRAGIIYLSWLSGLTFTWVKSRGFSVQGSRPTWTNLYCDEGKETVFENWSCIPEGQELKHCMCMWNKLDIFRFWCKPHWSLFLKTRPRYVWYRNS